MSTAPPADRYGARTRPRWVWWVVAAVGISIGVAWSAWIAFQPRPVSAVVWGYDVISDTRTDVILDVRRSDDDPVQCTVYVQAEDHSVVGERTAQVAPSGTEKTRVTVRVETERRGVNGILRTCETTN